MDLAVFSGREKRCQFCLGVAVRKSNRISNIKLGRNGAALAELRERRHVPLPGLS